MKQVTLKDLSNYLLLSTSTISRALAGNKNIRRETRETVEEAARKLGYRPNPLAQNLKLGRSKSIGVIVPEMTTPFSSGVIDGIQKTFEADGYRVIIAQSAEDPETERRNLLLMEQFHVDGIIISLCHKTRNLDICREFLEKGIPLVQYDRIAPELPAPKVIVDDYAHSVALMEHLIRSGRKKIVHLQGPDHIHNSSERCKAYRDSLQRSGISFHPSFIIETGLAFDDGMLATRELLKRKIAFDAIFAFTDTIAIGAMNYLQENGVRVPDDVAVASFSGTVLSTIVHPQLTTVDQPLEEIGRRAAELIIRQLKKKNLTDETVRLNAELKLRASTM